jgi:hypothetical protein
MNTVINIKKILPLVILNLALFGLQSAGAITIVAPNNLANAYGGAVNLAPFDIAGFYAPSMRYQQMYDASQFGSIAAGGGYITQIAFRAASIDGAFSATLPNIQFDLSTTANTSLSSTFADNVGANDIEVFGGSWSFSSVGGAAGPSVFDIVLNLTTPFFYNPADGNLVLDVRNIGGGASAYFDDSFQAGEGVSRVYASDVSASTGASDNEGLVTQFTVPDEPSSVGLLGMGIFGLFALRKKSLANN